MSSILEQMNKKRTVVPVVTDNTSGFYGGEITGSPLDDAAYYADLARDWAISEELVEDPIATDYSSKTWALTAKAVVVNFDGVADGEIERIIAEGDTQVLRVTNEGDIQVDRATTEADRAEAEADRATSEADRADTEADRSHDEADRAYEYALGLSNTLRNGGNFDPAMGVYPIPVNLEFAWVYYSIGPGNIGEVNWSIGDMLSYVPHPTDPVNTQGQYYRIAGELAEGGEPQPIVIPDDLIMVQNKRIRYAQDAETFVDAMHVDLDGDLVIGDLSDDTPGPVVLEQIGLASTAGLIHIKESDGLGAATVFYDIITNEAGDVIRTIGDQNMAGLKTFSRLPQAQIVPTTGNEFTNKTYVDGVATAGTHSVNGNTLTITF